MNTQEALKKLDCFGSEIAVLLDAFKKLEIEYNPSSTDDKYLSEKINLLLDSLALAEEDIQYLNKPVIMEGVINLQGDKVYINDLELMEHDKIECFIDNCWDDCEVTKINSEFHLGLMPVTHMTHRINARIRLTKEEENLRVI